jgi:hypothetical protein
MVSSREKGSTKKTAKNDCRGSDLLPYGERKENEEKIKNRVCFVHSVLKLLM